MHVDQTPYDKSFLLFFVGHTCSPNYFEQVHSSWSIDFVRSILFFDSILRFYSCVKYRPYRPYRSILVAAASLIHHHSGECARVYTVHLAAAYRDAYAACGDWWCVHCARKLLCLTAIDGHTKFPSFFRIIYAYEGHREIKWHEMRRQSPRTHALYRTTCIENKF